MTTYKDTDLREALRRMYADTPPMPEDLNERLMKRKEAREQKIQHHRRWPYPVIATAAASVLLMIVGGVWVNRQKPLPTAEEVQPKREYKTEKMSFDSKTANAGQTVEPHIAEKELPETAPTAKRHSSLKHREAINKQTDEGETEKQNIQVAAVIDQPSSAQSPSDAHLHYASNVTSADSTYISPVLMDEYIRKLAAYNGVKPETLDCDADSTYTNQTCEAYVFADTKETDVFGRLLLAAIAYDDTMPGYLFNYTHQQFFFTVIDQRTERRFLWVAERIAGDRILLYSASLPIGADVPSECFQKYRNKLTNTITPKTK